jgi:hypothetical protein
MLDADVSPSIAAVITDLNAAYSEFTATLAGLSAEDLEQPLAAGAWRVRDVVTNVNHWNRWRLNRLKHIVAHGSWESTGKRLDVDEVNRRVVEAWSLHPVTDVLAELHAYYGDAMAFLTALPAEWGDQTWAYGSRTTNLQKWFAYSNEHYREHAAQIKEWRDAR